MNIKHNLNLLCIVGLSLAMAVSSRLALAQELGYSDTPIIPGTPWHVHDGKRPQPGS